MCIRRARRQRSLKCKGRRKGKGRSRSSKRKSRHRRSKPRRRMMGWKLTTTSRRTVVLPRLRRIRLHSLLSVLPPHDNLFFRSLYLCPASLLVSASRTNGNQLNLRFDWNPKKSTINLYRMESIKIVNRNCPNRSRFCSFLDTLSGLALSRICVGNRLVSMTHLLSRLDRSHRPVPYPISLPSSGPVLPPRSALYRGLSAMLHPSRNACPETDPTRISRR